MLPCFLPMRPTDRPCFPQNLVWLLQTPNRHTDTHTMQLPSATVRSLFCTLKKKISKFTQLLLFPHSEQISLTKQMHKLFPDICVWLSCWSSVLCWCWQRAHGMCVNCRPYSMNMHLHLSWTQWCFPSSDPRLASLSVSHPWTGVRVKQLLTKMKRIVAQKKMFSVAATCINRNFLIMLSCLNNPVTHSCCGDPIRSQVFPHKD